MLAGVKVFRPLSEDTPIDLLVLRASGRVSKCQCKYLYLGRRGSHTMNCYSIRKNGPGAKAVMHKYTPDEVDFFLGYCSDNDSVYVIPYPDVAGRSILTFWVLREPVGQNGVERVQPSKWLAAYDLLK